MSKRKLPDVKGDRPPVVLVDMDGTIADFDSRAYALMAARHPDVAMPVYKQREFPLSRGLPAAQRPLLEVLFKEEGFFREMQPIEGAVAALNEMVAAGIDVRLCSSPLSSSPCCVMEKVEWAVAHLGKSWVDRIILTRDKTLVRGDILLDDAPQAKSSSLEPMWEHVYFDQPCNRSGASDADPSRRRLVAWKDWGARCRCTGQHAGAHLRVRRHVHNSHYYSCS